MVKLGENIAREWEEDPDAPLIWDALQLIKSDSMAGLDALMQLAKNGSALSMMYFGNVYLEGEYGVEVDVSVGERWLRSSADAGSIEGKYRLAKHLQFKKSWDDAEILYHDLAERKYSPAMYVLGQEYYLGENVESDIEKSIEYFEMAEAEGHVISAYSLAGIFMKERGDVVSWFRGVAKRIAICAPMARLITSYPNSDLLRR